MHLHRNWTLALTIGAIWTLSAAGLHAEDYKVVTEKNVQYGTASGEKLLLDLAKPEGLKEPAPAIVFIHGGGWAAGNKEGYDHKIEQMAARGYVAVTVEYRFAPKYHFPAQVEDCKCAVRWLRAHAKELNVDPDRIGALGDSAGGHLVLMLGTMDPKDGLEGDGGWADQSSKVQAVVSYYGPTNFLDEYPPKSKDIVANFIGGSMADKKDEYRRASPITYVNEGDAPTLMFQGTADDLVPYNQAEQMATALTNAHVPGRVELILGSGHGFGGAEGERIFKDATDFLDQYLRKKK